MDAQVINAMNKKQLAAELRKFNLPCSGNKSELKSRLRNHVETTVVQTARIEDDNTDEDDDDDDVDGEMVNAFVRAERLEKELQEKSSELVALRARMVNSTANREPRTNTEPNATRSEARPTAHTEVNDPVHNEQRRTNAEPCVTPVERERGMMTSVFSFRDIEESLSTFSGSDTYTVRKWIADTERNAKLFKWNDLQQLMYALRLLKGPAKQCVRSFNPNSWAELKDELIEQFDVKLSGADVHKKLSERKKLPKETLQEYLIAMIEIGRANDVEDESIIQYVIDGVDDDPRNKGMLFGASSMKEFRLKLIAYEKFRSGFAKKKDERREAKTESKPANDKAGPSRRNDRKCYGCGEEGHISAKCPRKGDGEKCFACNEFGHRSTVCPTREKKVMLSKTKLVGDMYKTVKINDCVISALIDTGCDLNLIREDAAKCFEIPCVEDASLLSGLGGKQTTTVGSFMAKVKIDGAMFESKFYVVEKGAMSMLAIIGKDLMAEAEVNIKNNVVIFKRATEDENFLMNIQDEGVTGDSGSEIPAAVQKMVRNYKPNKTKTTSIELKVQLTDDIPVNLRPRRLAYAEKEIVEKQVAEWIRDGVAIECPSDYASPVVVVKKKDGGSRLCVDYRCLNRKMIKDRFPVPLIEDQLDALQGAKVFSTIDLKNGFFHVPVSKESRKYLAFVTHNGQYTFLKTPFGCSNSPRVFQRFINHVFRDLIRGKIVLVYVDDIIILAKDEDEAILRLARVLECAAQHGLEINWRKCQFLKRTVEFLGYIIENGTIKPSLTKTNAVRKFPEPKTIKQIQSFLGLTGYFRKFIEDYATIARPLSDILRKQNAFVFGVDQRRAFERLKERLMCEPVLKIYQQDAETELHTDASKFGFGAVLLQRCNDDQQLHPVFYMSTKTSPAEEKYDSYMLETLAVVKALEKFRIYLLDKEFKIVTDCDALNKTMKMSVVNRKVAGYVEFMQDFSFEMVHRSGERMKHVDSLSRNTVMVISGEENLAAKIKMLQRDDDGLKHIFEILKTQPYDDFILRNGVLYKYERGIELIVVPKSIEGEVIRNAHDNGHFGVKKMEQQIRQRYYITSLAEKLMKCVRTCVRCILTENKHGKGEGFLHSIDKEELPLQTYHIDHVGTMVATCKMYQHILVVVDAFTKFTWLYPTKTTNAKEVLEKLRLQQTTFGNPKRIISDKGAAFTSKEFQEYCKNEAIEHCVTTTGMPRANGQVERINRCIIPVLTKAAIDEPNKWFKYVPYVQQALNSTFQRSIATTPFQLLIGIPMRRKEDVQMAELLEENFALQFVDERNKSRVAAKAQILKVQSENKRTFDKKRKTASEFKVGDLVAIKRTQFVNGNKLATKFLGPYRVVKVKANERYDVSKEGRHEGPNTTSTGAEYMKRWNSSEADEEEDGRM